MLSLDSGVPLDTRKSMGTSGNVFGSPLARELPPSAFFENSKNFASSSCGQGSGNTLEHGKGRDEIRRVLQHQSHVLLKAWNLEPFVSYWRNLFSKWCRAKFDLEAVDKHATISDRIMASELIRRAHPARTVHEPIWRWNRTIPSMTS